MPHAMDQRALKKDPDSVKKQQIAIDKKCHTHYLLAMKIQYSRDMLKKMKDEKTIARNYGKLAGRIVLSLSVFLGKNMVLARTSPFYLARCGYLESLFRRTFGFHFRHNFCPP